MKSHSPGARRFRGAIILGLWGALVLGSGCAGRLPDSGVPSNCGDRCGSFSCPPDTHCTESNACAPSCVPDTLAPR